MGDRSRIPHPATPTLTPPKTSVQNQASKTSVLCKFTEKKLRGPWKGLMVCLEDFGIPKPRIKEERDEREKEQQQWFVFAI